MTVFRWFMFAVLIAGFSARVEAASETERIREDEEISQRAKQRQYRGGPDESDLKVQNLLPKPTRKVAPTVEEEPSESDE